jgi:hypothetical protein
MTITAPATTTARTAPHPVDPMRNHARAAGIFYLLTFVSSIPALILIGPILHNANYVTSAGHDTRVLWGCLLDSVNAITAVASAVALYPVVKRQNQSMALGFVTSRLLEGAIVMIGVVSLLAVVTMRQDFASSGGDSTSLTTTANALVELRDWTFLLGPGLMPAFNAVLLGTLFYRSRLVPRIIPTVGLIGAPLLFAAFLAIFFGMIVPVAVWEFSVGVWMLVKGFNPSAVAALSTSRSSDQ